MVRLVTQAKADGWQTAVMFADDVTGRAGSARIRKEELQMVYECLRARLQHTWPPS